MKFVITKHIQAFKFFEREKRGDGEEYVYLHDFNQVRGLREIYIVLYDFNAEPEEKIKLMKHLQQYNSDYNEIYYELGSVN